jgi:hypothetical protein
MTGLDVGEKVKVRYVDISKDTYTLDVEVTKICPFNEFIGRVERVFAYGDGEITGGNILDELKGQERTFKTRLFYYVVPICPRSVSPAHRDCGEFAVDACTVAISRIHWA